MRIRFLVCLACLLLSTGVMLAADWPQWRGPLRDGVTKETGLLKEWPKDGPKLVWRVAELGGGFSTPAVVFSHLLHHFLRGLNEPH